MEPSHQARAAQPGQATPGESQLGQASVAAKEIRLHFACPACQKWLSVPVRSTGMKEYCPGCGGMVRIPAIDDHTIGVDLLRQTLAPPQPLAAIHHEPVSDQLPPVLDEFELTALEVRTFQREIQQRCDLVGVAAARESVVKVRAKDAIESPAQYIGRLLAAMPAAARARQQWTKEQVDPLFGRLTQLQGQTFPLSEVAVDLGAYHTESQSFPLKLTLPGPDGLSTVRRELSMSPNLARGWYASWSEVRKTGTLGVGLGGRRVLRSLRLADRSTGESFDLSFEQTLSDAHAAVLALAFSPSGRFLAVGTTAGIEIHDLAPGGEVHRLRGLAGNSVSFHPDGRLLAVASTGCTIWNLDALEAFRRTKSITHVDFSPDGQWLLCGSGGGVMLVAVRDPSLSLAIDDPGGEPLVWCPDGRYFLIHNRLFEVPACRPIGTLPVTKVGPGRFSRDGELLALASRDGEVLLFRVPGISPSERLPHPRPVRSLAFSPDGSMIATGQGSDRDPEATSQLTLWETRTGTLVKRTGHPGPVTAIEFSPDGSHLVIGSLTGRLRVLQADSWPDAISD